MCCGRGASVPAGRRGEVRVAARRSGSDAGWVVVYPDGREREVRTEIAAKMITAVIDGVTYRRK
jgi:hypothetical protein